MLTTRVLHVLGRLGSGPINWFQPQRQLRPRADAYEEYGNDRVAERLCENSILMDLARTISRYRRKKKQLFRIHWDCPLPQNAVPKRLPVLEFSHSLRTFRPFVDTVSIGANRPQQTFARFAAKARFRLERVDKHIPTQREDMRYSVIMPDANALYLLHSSVAAVDLHRLKKELTHAR